MAVLVTKKEKFFMTVVLIFLVSCGDINTNDNQNDSFNGGLYGLQILQGDIHEKPASQLLIKDMNDSVISDTSFTLQKDESITFKSLMQPSAVRDASMFETVSTSAKGITTSTSCHTGLYNNNCTSTYTYKPYCSGTVQSILKLRVDNAAAKNITILGISNDFPNKCIPDISDNTTYTVAPSSVYMFKNINEIFYFTAKASKPVNNNYKIQANGSYNGFYYSYACFHNDNNCYGFIQFTGKIGKYDCKGQSELKLRINPNLSGTQSSPFTISVSGFGLGKDDNITCIVK